MPKSAPLSPFLTGISHRFFPPRGQCLGRGGWRPGPAQQSHFPGLQLLLRESCWYPTSQPVWARRWRGTGSPWGPPTWGWGCAWPFAGDGQRVFGGGLVASPLPVGSSELLQPHLCEHPVEQQPRHGVRGAACPCPEASVLTHPPPPHPQLVLYCHLHGSTTSSLSIFYVINSTKHLMRERTGDLGSCWVRERVDFNVTGSFKVGLHHAGASWAACGARGTGPPHRGHSATHSTHTWDQG